VSHRVPPGRAPVARVFHGFHPWLLSFRPSGTTARCHLCVWQQGNCRISQTVILKRQEGRYRMAKVTLVFALLLAVLGLAGYLGTGSLHPTALIPTWIGWRWACWVSGYQPQRGPSQAFHARQRDDCAAGLDRDVRRDYSQHDSRPCFGQVAGPDRDVLKAGAGFDFDYLRSPLHPFIRRRAAFGKV